MRYTAEERVDIITYMLKEDRALLIELDEERLRDYVSCISSFFTTDDLIIAESNIKTMHLNSRKEKLKIFLGGENTWL